MRQLILRVLYACRTRCGRYSRSLVFMFVAIVSVLSGTCQIGAATPVVLRFEAIVEERAPLAKTWNTLWLEYEVTEHQIRMHVVWAEPQAARLNFAYYPVGLELTADSGTLEILSHASGKRWLAPIVVAPRRSFSSKFNGYPLDEMARAIGEHRWQRSLWLSSENTLTASVPGMVAAIPLKDHGEVLKSLTINVDSNHWQVQLPERKWVGTGLLGEIRVNHTAVPLQSTDLPRHSGGRVVDLQIRDLAASPPLRFPHQIIVRKHSDLELLRTCTIQAVTSVPLGSLENPVGHPFETDSADEQSWRQSLEQWWGVAPIAIPPQEYARVLESARKYQRQALAPRHSSAKRIKYGFMAALTYALLGEEHSFRVAFQQYAHNLRHGGSAFGALHGLLSWKRLCARWPRVTLPKIDAEIQWVLCDRMSMEELDHVAKYTVNTLSPFDVVLFSESIAKRPEQLNELEGLQWSAASVLFDHAASATDGDDSQRITRQLSTVIGTYSQASFDDPDSVNRWLDLRKRLLEVIPRLR